MTPSCAPIDDHGGYGFPTGEDGFGVAFVRAPEGVAAAVDAQSEG